MKRLNLLVLSCGTNSAFHFIKVLREKFSEAFRIIGADTNKAHLVPSNSNLNAFFQVPFSNESGYYELILRLCKSEKIDVILPIFDADQRLFYRENPDLARLGVFSLGASEQSLEFYADKVKMSEFLAQNGFLIPRVFENLGEFKDKENADKKFFVKPKDGFGSLGVRVLSAAQILQLKERENFIIQELCFEPEITLECFFYERRIATLARQRLAVKAGVCTKARIFHSNELEKIALKFANALQTPLYFNLQFMKNAKFEFVITDVNLRLAGGMGLGAASGWDAVSAVAKVLLSHFGREKFNTEQIFETLARVSGEIYALRTYADIISTRKNGVVAFDLDGTLLDSRKRHEAALKSVLGELGASVKTSDFVEFKRGGKNTFEFLLACGVERNLAQKAHEMWVERIENDEFLHLDELYANALERLGRESLQWDLILITARKRKNALLAQLKRLGVWDFFREVFVVSPLENVAQQKARILAEQNAALMVGDSETDAKAAKLAGVKFEFSEGGFRNKEFIVSLAENNALITGGGGNSLLNFYFFVRVRCFTRTHFFTFFTHHDFQNEKSHTIPKKFTKRNLALPNLAMAQILAKNSADFLTTTPNFKFYTTKIPQIQQTITPPQTANSTNQHKVA